MSYRLPPLSVLRTFEAAARHLSFKKAAEEVHVTPAAVSQQIKALETYLGVPLFHRLTRALELTQHGAAMLPKIREGFECLAAAVETTLQAQALGLTVTAPPSFAAHWLIPRLPRFSTAYPDVELRLSSTPDSVDRQGEVSILDGNMVDLREDHSLVAIRYGTGDYPGFRVDKIFAPEYVPVCAPRLMAESPPLARPEDLGRYALIHDETLNVEELQPGWQEWFRLAGVSNVETRRGLRFSNAVLAVGAALDGQGVALALRPMVEADVAAGRLCIPFDISVPSPYTYWLVMPEAVSKRPPVAAFRDWLLAEAQPPLLNPES